MNVQRSPENRQLSIPKGELFAQRFEILAQLGTGSYGRVTRCFDRDTQSEIALKELYRFSPDALLRFKKEFRALSDVQHPNLVRLYELFEGESGQWAFSMELVPGTDFLTYVRRPDVTCGYDEHRLRAALAELTKGLCALHSLGMMHRDVKPENIRVTPEGRVVLLDFGLVTHLEAGKQTTEIAGVGTAAYMAPEQVSQRVGPEADFYAVGALLYEALTGRLPFEGNAVAILLDKASRPPVSPRVHNESVSRELEELCLRLLERDVATRATASDVFRVVGGQALSSPPHLGAATSPSSVFVGREQELDALRAEWRRVRDGDLRVVMIEGASGIGKTALMEESVREFVEDRPELLLLRGRCHAAEQVRYKLWDGVVDALCKYLLSVSPAECRELLPSRAEYLPLLFPVLSRVQAIPKPDVRRILMDAVTQRFTMFAQFGELLERVSRKTPLVVCVDDIQWGDLDSLAVLQVLLSLDQKPRLLLLATVRPLDELEPDLESKLLDIMKSSTCLSRLSLGALDPHASARLSSALLSLGSDHPIVQQVAAEARGNPWCAVQMAQSLVESDRESPPLTDLDVALRCRIDKLGPEARRTIELLAVAGGPQPGAVLRHALGVEGATLEHSLSVLRAHKLVRTAKRGTWVCYHDRVREAVLGAVLGAVRKAAHAGLAEAWRREGGAPERIAAHFRAADEPLLALPWLERAAEAAEQTSAYGQAAALYSEALKIREERGEAPSALHGLRLKLADALSYTGRGADSARVLLTLLETAPPRDRANLLTRAAEQLLRAGEVREGVETARTAFEALDMPWPKTQARAIARMLAHRLLLGVRGYKVKLRREPLSTLDRERLDALLRLAQPLSWADLLRTGELSLRYLRAALESGDPDHVAKALLGEGMMSALQDPGGPQARDLLAQADALVERSGSPALHAERHLAHGSALVSAGEPLRATRELEIAQTLLVEQCPTETWQLSNGRSIYMPARILTGQHRGFLADAERWHSEAQLRGDTFAVTACVVTGAAYTRHLFKNCPERALAEIDAAMAVWQGETFGVQHCFALTAKQVVLCYEGGTKAFELLHKEWPRARKSVLFRINFTRELLWVACASAALSAVVAEPENKTFRALLDTACRDLPKASTYFGKTSGALLLAQKAWLKGDVPRSLELSRETEQHWMKAGIYTHRHAGLLAAVCTRAKDAEDRAKALCEWLRGEGWIHPERAIQMVLPIYPMLEKTWA